MLNYNDNEQALQAFYGSTVLEPRTIADFTKVDDLRPPEDLDQLSTDEQCAVLVNFLKDADDAHTSAYRFGGEDLKDPLTGQDL
ncbi:Exocyst complex component S5, partial [Candidozyma auris]